MAEFRQQYLDVLQGYGVDPASLRGATDAQLKRILQQTAQGRDIGGEMASGTAAAGQAAQDVIGGTTPVQSLESLLAEAHTGAPIATQAGAAADLPMSEATPQPLPRGLRIQGDITGQQPAGDPERPSMEPIPGWKPTEELVAEAHTMPGARSASAGAADLPMSEATVQPLAVDARIEQDRLRREQEQEAARLAKQPKAQIAPGHSITIAEGGPRPKKNMLQSLAGVEVVTPSAADFGTPVEEATDEEKDIVSRQVLAQDVENVRDGGTPMISFQSDAFSSEAVDPRVADILGELTDAEKEQYLLKYGGSEEEVKRAIEEGVLPSGAQRVQRDVAEMRPSTMQAEGIRGDRTAGIGGLPEGAVEQPDMPTTPEAQRPGLLGRLGGMIKDNPEVAAQIAQAAGGLMSNIASGRAEREAGRETEGRVARANLISALTGGKTRPQVTAAQADEGGLLSRLGQITTAGGKIATGEMERRRAEDVEERGIGLKERQVDTMDRRLDIMQDKINKDFQADLAAANAELSKATGASYERVQGGIEHLNKATNLYKSGGYLDPTSGAKGLYGRMQTVWEAYEENPSAAGVGAIFQIYQRFFDPATVREGDLKIMEEAQGPLNRLKAAYERIQSEGGTLSSDVVEEMKNLADKTHQYDIEKAKDSVNAYIENAIAPQDRQATLNYYDRLFTVAPVPGTGGATELTEALQSGEIILD